MLYKCANPGCPGEPLRASDYPHRHPEPAEPEDWPGPIATDEWEPDPEKPGYLRFVRMRTRGEVLSDLNSRLAHLAHLSEESPQSFDLWRFRWIAPSGEGPSWTPGRSERIEYEEPMPRARWLACFAVAGSNEGHYVHIEALSPNEREDGYHSELIFLCKTFCGADAALELANAAARELGAV